MLPSHCPVILLQPPNLHLQRLCPAPRLCQRLLLLLQLLRCQGTCVLQRCLNFLRDSQLGVASSRVPLLRCQGALYLSQVLCQRLCRGVVLRVCWRQSTTMPSYLLVPGGGGSSGLCSGGGCLCVLQVGSCVLHCSLCCCTALLRLCSGLLRLGMARVNASAQREIEREKKGESYRPVLPQQEGEIL